MGGVSYGSILCEVSKQARDQEPGKDHYEKREACHSGYMPVMWHQGFSYRSRLTAVFGFSSSLITGSQAAI